MKTDFHNRLCTYPRFEVEAEMNSGSGLFIYIKYTLFWGCHNLYWILVYFIAIQNTSINDVN